jgi:hypothetical protein
MNEAKSSTVVIAELGADWAGHADAGRGRFGGVFTLLQQPGEAPHAFARRVQNKLRALRGVTTATLLWRTAGDRRSIAARCLELDSCLQALAGAPKRELSLVMLAKAKSRLPRWVQVLARGVEARDPGLNVTLAFDGMFAAA